MNTNTTTSSEVVEKNHPLVTTNAGTGKWSGRGVYEGTVPPIGALIKVTMNSLGPARVISYTIINDFLTLMVEFLNPPGWWIRQNGKATDNHGLIFGVEIDAPTPSDEAAAMGYLMFPAERSNPTHSLHEPWVLRINSAFGRIVLRGKTRDDLARKIPAFVKRKMVNQS